MSKMLRSYIKIGNAYMVVSVFRLPAIYCRKGHFLLDFWRPRDILIKKPVDGICAEVVELADALDSGSSGETPCGFKSRLRHHLLN